jgi:hypothetical protein
MLDNLRSQTSFQPDEEEPQEPIGSPKKTPRPPRRKRSIDQLTGMTAPQRFMLSMMLMTMVCLVGVIILVALQKVVPPGF